MRILLATILLSSCTLQKTGSWRLPAQVPESSALVHLGGDTLVTLNDSGNGAELFLLAPNGKALRVTPVPVPGATNHDWEAMTVQGDYLWIGDIGNNANQRTNLALYRISVNELKNCSITQAKRFPVEYPDQTAYPPPPHQKMYDAEALVAIGENLYIFTKNRTKPFTGSFHVYQLSAHTDSTLTVAQMPSGKLKAGTPNFRFRITDAALSPDGRLLLLLAPDRIWFFAVHNGQPDFSKPIKIKRFVKKSVREAISFTSDNDIAITSENYKIWKARLWIYRIKL
jgi:hypothetical protein